MGHGVRSDALLNFYPIFSLPRLILGTELLIFAMVAAEKLTFEITNSKTIRQ